jgi:hypothetical protein
MNTANIELTEDKLMAVNVDKQVLFGDATSRAWLKSVLTSSVATVTFTKKNGDERVMKCTLDPQHLPAIQKEASEVAEVRQPSKDSLAVFDIEAQAWRSFRFDSVTKLTMDL